MEPYLEALHAQMERKEVRDLASCYLVDSIFFGGGTPSLLPPKEVNRLLTHLGQIFEVSPFAEITLEMNPGTQTKEEMRDLRKAGVNRLSLGVQTMDDGLLQKIGRTHTAADVGHDLNALREAGFENINMDFISGLPGQTSAQLSRDLDLIGRAAPEHVSWYAMILEEQSWFGFQKKQGLLDWDEEDLQADLMEQVLDGLSALGYERYEISNFSKPGFASKHNLKYWSGSDYLGLGIGAASYLEGERFEVTRGIHRFIRYAGTDRPLFKRIPRSRKDDLFEQLMTGMRKIRGMELERFRERNGISLRELAPRTFTKGENRGLILEQEGRLAFTSKGMMLSNDFFSDVLLEMEQIEKTDRQ